MADKEKHHHHHLFHHHKEEENPVEATSETVVYSEGHKEHEHDYGRDEKHHKHLEHLSEMAGLAAGAYALVCIFLVIFLFLIPKSVIYTHKYIFVHNKPCVLISIQLFI